MLPPMQRPALAIPRLSSAVALVIGLAIIAAVAWVHFRDGPHAHLHVRLSSSGMAAAATPRCRST